MIDLGATIAAMKEAGMDDASIVAALACLRQTGATTVDLSAERRRAKDRERKRLRNSAEFHGTDADTPPSEQEGPHTPKELNLPLPTTQQEKTPKGVQKKASRLPADWTLPDEWRHDAIAVGLPPHLIDIEAAKMRDWSLSSKNGAKLDWRATWRNWCREAAARLPQNRAPPPRPMDNLIASLITKMDDADASTTAEIEGYPAAPRRLSSH